MIRSPATLNDLERHYAQTYVARRSYAEALAIFAALWRHARLVNPELPTDWREDVEPDITLARVLNGLPDRG